MADNTQINDFFDLAAFAEQAQIIVNESAKTAKLMREQFAEVGKGLNADGLQKYAAAAEKLQSTQRAAKQVLSDYEKAQERLTKSQGDYNRDLERLDELLKAEAQSTAAMAAQNKALEQIRKNLNTTDKDYAATVQKIIDKQNANIKVMKEFQNVEQKRTSGIGKYKEAIEAAMNTTGGYRAQLMNIRNTMAEVEQAIMAAKEAHGEESEEVRSLQAEYEKLQQRAGKLQDAQNDMQARIKYLADDYGKLKAVLQGMQAAMGIVSVFQGATAALGIHSQAVEKTTKNMAALIAMMQGLKQVQELLNKDNYFAQLIKQSSVLTGGINKLSAAFKTLGMSVKAAAGYFGVLLAAFTLYIKAVREAAKGNEFAQFSKNLANATDESDRLAQAQEFLQKQFGNTAIKLGDINGKLKATKQGFADIVQAIAETALTEQASTKLKELADEALQLAFDQQQARTKIAEIEEEIAKKEAAIKKTVDEMTKKKSNLAYVGMATEEDRKSIQRYRDQITAINDALKEQKDAYDQNAASYRDLMAITSEQLSASLGNILQGVDLSGLLAKEADEGTQAVQKETEAVKELSEVLNTTTEMATAMQWKSLANVKMYAKAVEELQRQFLTGQITIEQYEEELSNITFRQQQDELQAAIDALKEQNEVLDANSAEYVRNATEIAKLQKQLNDLNFAKFRDEMKKNTQAVKESSAALFTNFDLQLKMFQAAAKKGMEGLLEVTQKVMDAISTISNDMNAALSDVSEAIYSAQAGRLAKEEAEMAQHYELQRAYIEANVQDEEERQQKLAQLALDEANAKAIAARKEAEVERKKAKVDLAITKAKASADIAAAIAAAVLSASAGDPYTLAVRIAAAVLAVLSAGAAVASAAAKIGNIPAFERGGEAKRGLVFRAGEKGYEVGKGVSGRSYLFPRDGVYVAPEPMRIHPHSDSVQMVNNYNKQVTLRSAVSVKVYSEKRIEKYFSL